MSWQNFITDLVKSGGSPLSKMVDPTSGRPSYEPEHEVGHTREGVPEEEEEDPQKKFDWKKFFVPPPQQGGGQGSSSTGEGSLASGGGQLAGKGIATLLKMFI